MACFFAPMHFAPMHNAHYRPPAHARNRACSVSPLALVFFGVFVAPMLVRVALVFIATALNLFFTIAPLCAMIALTKSLCCADETESREGLSSVKTSADRCCGIRKAFAKMKAAKEASRSEEPDKKTTPAKTKSDLSSGSVVESADGALRVTIAAPGVKQSDLKVTVGGQTLSIKGETARVVEVDRVIMVPSIIDLDSAECTHADGVLTITLKRKESKTIKVNVQTAAETEAQTEEGLPVGVEDAAAQDSEGEWVESAPPAVKKDQ